MKKPNPTQCENSEEEEESAVLQKRFDNSQNLVFSDDTRQWLPP